MIHPPHVQYLIGPVWPRVEQAQAAARIVSAADGGLSIAYYQTPNMSPGWGGYTLAGGAGRAIAGWETAEFVSPEDRALVADDPVTAVTAAPDEVTGAPMGREPEVISYPFTPAGDPASSVAPEPAQITSSVKLDDVLAGIFHRAILGLRVPDGDETEEVAGLGEALNEATRPPGDPRFRALLDELWDLHCRKSADYGADGDPLSNVRSGADWGVPNWVATMIRATDKLRRLQTFARRGTLQNEGARDNLVDLAAYCLLAVLLLDEVDEVDRATGEGETDG